MDSNRDAPLILRKLLKTRIAKKSKNSKMGDRVYVEMYVEKINLHGNHNRLAAPNLCHSNVNRKDVAGSQLKSLLGRRSKHR